jgi:hypothetical protein
MLSRFTFASLAVLYFFGTFLHNFGLENKRSEESLKTKVCKQKEGANG